MCSKSLRPLRSVASVVNLVKLVLICLPPIIFITASRRLSYHLLSRVTTVFLVEEESLYCVSVESVGIVSVVSVGSVHLRECWWPDVN